MPKIALICNIVVVCGGLYHHVRVGNFSIQRALPFVLLSVPMAYLGGRIPISKTVFLILLGGSLAIAGLRLLFINQGVKKSSLIPTTTALVDRRSSSFIWLTGLAIGVLLGFISGLVGIGGGIFLSPILYLTRWGNAKQIAALCSFFILVNSLSGLAGQITKSGFATDLYLILPLVIAVFLGGQIGSGLSVSKLSIYHLQRITAVLILFASARIFVKVLI